MRRQIKQPYWYPVGRPNGLMGGKGITVMMFNKINCSELPNVRLLCARSSTIKGMAPPTFYNFRARNANFHGTLQSQASYKLITLQHLMKPKDTLYKNKTDITFNILATKFPTKMKHIIPGNVAEKARVVCQLFYALIDN